MVEALLLGCWDLTTSGVLLSCFAKYMQNAVVEEKLKIIFMICITITGWGTEKAGNVQTYPFKNTCQQLKVNSNFDWLIGVVWSLL